MALSGIPANAPSGDYPHTLAIWSGRPPLTRYDQQELCVRSWMRADDAARFNSQARQVHLAVALRDSRDTESFAAVPPDDLLSTVELEDLHEGSFH